LISILSQSCNGSAMTWLRYELASYCCCCSWNHCVLVKKVEFRFPKKIFPNSRNIQNLLLFYYKLISILEKYNNEKNYWLFFFCHVTMCRSGSWRDMYTVCKRDFLRYKIIRNIGYRIFLITPISMNGHENIWVYTRRHYRLIPIWNDSW